ncbi:MAG: sterol desaturase family protein [Bacteroidota bacterium]
METYATFLSYAIPGFVLLILIESVTARLMGMKINVGLDTISSLSSGMTNTLKSILGLSVVIISYGWMVEHMALMQIESTIWVYIICFIGVDFAAYWSHRFNHEINLFWNRHIVHHSSEEFNLACALRQTIAAFIGIYFFLNIPMALLGIPTKVLAIVAPLHLFAQFWYHTRLIKRMGFLEHILVTPSHHRVHHAINKEYLDKNYAAIFIVWDKWFGTFQEELEDVPAVYGTKKPVNTWNPFLINFMHVWGIAKDAFRTKNWWDKIRIWFMPTGWRPADVKDKYPVQYWEKASDQIKYTSPASRSLEAWSWIQLVVNNLFLYHLLVSIGDLNATEIILYAAFIGLSIFAYTSMMDRHPIAVLAEGCKLLLGLGLVIQSNSWFGLETAIPGGLILVLAYMALAFGLTLFFTYFEKTIAQAKS